MAGDDIKYGWLDGKTGEYKTGWRKPRNYTSRPIAYIHPIAVTVFSGNGRVINDVHPTKVEKALRAAQ